MEPIIASESRLSPLPLTRAGSPSVLSAAAPSAPMPRDERSTGAPVDDPSGGLKNLARELPRQRLEAPSTADHAGGLEAEPTSAPPAELLPVPDTYQSTCYSCGASSLQAVLMYYGDEYSETELMQLLQTDPERGTHPRSIVRVARNLGFEAELRENLGLVDIEASLARKEPVIVAMQAWREGADLDRPWKEVWDSGHYVVVIGTDRENVYFEDPSLLGSRGVLPRAEFEKRWHDVDDVRFVQSGIFIRGKEPKPPQPFVHID